MTAAVQFLYLPNRHTRILCVASVEYSTHASHGCGDYVSLLKLGGFFFLFVSVDWCWWCRGYDACGFDSENSGELHGTVALAGEEFGAVEAEGFDADEDLAGLGDGDGALFWGEGVSLGGFFFFLLGEGGWCWGFFFFLFSFFLFLLEYNRDLPLLS